MNRRWALLFVVAVLSGAGATALARAPRPVPRAAIATAAPVVAMHVVLRGDSLAADLGGVALGTHVALTIQNRGSAPVRVRLAGYEDRVDTGPLEPDSSWTTTWTADRPGDDFAWLVGEELRGRFDVAGSHLVEGHR